jgi:hypothetical protein
MTLFRSYLILMVLLPCYGQRVVHWLLPAVGWVKANTRIREEVVWSFRIAMEALFLEPICF